MAVNGLQCLHYLQHLFPHLLLSGFLPCVTRALLPDPGGYPESWKHMTWPKVAKASSFLAPGSASYGKEPLLYIIFPSLPETITSPISHVI